MTKQVLNANTIYIKVYAAKKRDQQNNKSSALYIES